MVQSNIPIMSRCQQFSVVELLMFARRIANSAPCCVRFVCLFAMHLSPFLNSTITSFEQLKGTLLLFLLLQILP
jgi:hypothetical protein